MTVPGAAPVQRVRYSTTDADEGTEQIRGMYNDHSPTFSGGPLEDYHLELASDAVDTRYGHLRLDRLRHTMGMTAPAEPMPALVVGVMRSGSCGVTVGRETTGSAFLAPQWSGYTGWWDKPDVLLGSLDLDGVRRVGAEMSGLDASQVTFTGFDVVSPAAERYLRSIMIHIERNVLTHDELMAGPLLRAEAFRQLATAGLVAFPNTTHTLAPPARHDSGPPATVRRAMEFIDAHAQDDIDITQIAEAARIGPRGLQTAFRRHRAQTPLEYLRRVRLDGAHRDLQVADPTRGDTVAAVAARWGFTHPGRFSVEYARVYECSPSRTLRR